MRFVGDLSWVQACYDFKVLSDLTLVFKIFFSCALNEYLRKVIKIPDK